MRIVHEKRQVMALSREWRRRDAQVVGLVPTMGNLHEGHLALVRHAQERSDRVWVSVFVNPLQFNDPEDLQRYPRTLDEDARKLAELGVDALFCPSVEEIYPESPLAEARVVVPGLSGILEGASRPGHFDGVATVVTKLFNLLQPDVAVFGEKDFQQLRIIQAMVAALNIPVLIDSIPTVREPDGLALSSRNSLLTDTERRLAPGLYQVLRDSARSIQQATMTTATLDKLLQEARTRLQQSGFQPDYLTLRRCEDLAIPEAGDHDLILLAAAWLGKVRLIDNLRLAEL